MIEVGSLVMLYKILPAGSSFTPSSITSTCFAASGSGYGKVQF